MHSIFGKTDLSGVVTQLETIVAKLNEIATSAKVVSESFKVNVSFDSIGNGIKKEEEVVNNVKEFKCGAYDINNALAGTTLTVELRLYETKDPSETSNGTSNEETGKYKAKEVSLKMLS